MFGRSRLFAGIGQRAAAGLLILLSPAATPEAWLNSINLMSYAGIVSALLLLERLDGIGRVRRWGYRGLLVLSGLSGPYSVPLVPLFYVRHRESPCRESAIQLRIVGLTSTIQIGIYLYARFSGAIPEASRPGLDVAKAPVLALYYHVLGPLFGEWDLRRMIFPLSGAPSLPAYLDGLATPLALGLASLALAVLVGVLGLLLGRRPSEPRRLLVAGFVTTSLMVSAMALDGIPGGRYAIVPGLLLSLAIVDSVRDDRSRQRSRVAFVLIVVSLAMGTWRYRDGDYLRYSPFAPQWPVEAARWQRDPDHEIAVWPYPHWRFHLNRPALLASAKRALTEAGPITAACGEEEARRRVQVAGLPARTSLRFRLERYARAECRVDLLLEGSQGEEVHRQEVLPIHADDAEPMSAEIGSVDLPLPLPSELRQAHGVGHALHAVRALVMVFQSSGEPTRVELSSLELVADDRAEPSDRPGAP